MTTTTKDCPICMDSMTEIDLKHPMQCPGKCGFNFCVNCVEHLVNTSKMDYEEASDGSKQMKVKLTCPQCRSDLKDVAIEVVKKRKNDMVSGYMKLPDSELTATELRMKYASINAADIPKKINSQSPISVADEIAAMSAIIDTDLFCGLALSMTEEEQRYVYHLMTSCDVDRIAQGAQLLASISDLSRRGLTPSVRMTAGNNSSEPYSSRYPSTASNNLRTGRSNTAKSPTTKVVARAIAMSQTPEEKLQAAAEKRAKDHWLQNPLPRRMPISVTLHICHPLQKKFPLAFADDQWDGTIADAFSRALIDKKTLCVAVKKNNGKKNKGGTPKDEPKPEICESYTGPVERVLVASVKGEAGKKGIQVGDVITHVNGERFEGSATDLLRKIEYLAETGHESVSFVLNAEPATAAALSKRAFDLDNIRL